MSARIWAQQQFEYVPHVTVDGEVWTHVRYGTATTSGASDGTTVIDTNSDSGGPDAYNGRYWIRILSGTCVLQEKRIIDDDGSGTYTLEGNGFSAQIASGVEFQILISPDPVVVVDTSSGETNCVDAIRVDGDGKWIDYWLCPITGTHRGKKAQIIGFTSSTGTFGLGASFGSALAPGDVCKIRKFIEVEPPSDGLTRAYIMRPGQRVNFSIGDGAVGPKGGTLGFMTQLYPSAALAADGSKANGSVLSGLFQGAGLTESINTSEAIAAGSSTTAIKITTGTWEQFSIGQMVVWNGNTAWITAMTDGVASADTLTVSPALPQAPAAADILYASRMYRKSLTGDELGVLIEWEVDGRRITATGCKGNVDMQAGEPPKLSWAFTVDNFVEELEATPYNPGSAYTTAAPVLESDRIAWLSTTKTNVGEVTATPGAAVAVRPVQGATGTNGRAGVQHTGFDHRATWRELLDSSDTNLPQQERFLARTAKDLMVVMGSHGRCVGLRLPVARQVEATKMESVNGLAGVRCVWQAQDAGQTADGGGTLQKVPDWSICIT